jgi:FkbM family methyltransferase
LYKIINWYTKRFPFPRSGWKFARLLLRGAGLDNRSFCKKLHNGARMYVKPSEHIQQQLFWYGYYEKDAILTWEALIPEKGIVLDIGANTGYYSLIAAPKTLSVYAFEPSKATVEELEKNIRLNNFNTIHIQPFAIGKQAEEGNLYLSEPGNTGMTGLTVPANFSGKTEKVTIKTLDQWAAAQQLTQVDCIKIDVEGAEMDVLAGATRLLQQYKPIILIEIIAELLAKFNDTPSGIYQLLSACGYTAYEIVSPRLLRRLDKVKEAYSIVFLPANFILPPGIRLDPTTSAQ